jgi:hypothetical protein
VERRAALAEGFAEISGEDPVVGEELHTFKSHGKIEKWCKSILFMQMPSRGWSSRLYQFC